MPKYLWSFYEDAEEMDVADSVEGAIQQAKEESGGHYDAVYVWVANEAPYWEFDSEFHFDDELRFMPENQNCPPTERWTTYWGATREQLSELDETVSAAIRAWKEKHFGANSFYYAGDLVGKFDLAPNEVTP